MRNVTSLSHAVQNRYQLQKALDEESLPVSFSFESITSMFICAGLDYVKCAVLTRCGGFHEASG